MSDLMGIDPETLSDVERVLAIQRLFSLFYRMDEEQLRTLSTEKKLSLLRWALLLADDEATDKWQEEDYIKFDASAPSFVRLGPEDKCGFRNITFASDDEAAASSEPASSADIDTAGDAVPEQKPQRKSMFNPEEFEPSFEKERDDMATKTAKPAEGKKSKPAAEAHIETEYRIETEIVSKPLAWFTKSPYDTRQSRPDAWVKELAASLARDGQLTPCLARPDGQHIAGWTRVMAAPDAGLKELQVRIVHCDDMTARRLVLIENAKRRDLSEREQCEAYNALLVEYQASGKSQKQLAGDLSIDHSTLSNKVRLKSITEDIWDHYEADRLSMEQLRQVATHAMVPGFADAFMKSLKQHEPEIRPGKFAFTQAISDGFAAAYRPMTKGKFEFKLTEKTREKLGIVKVDHPRLGQVEVATKADVWDKLQQEAAGKKATKAEAAASATTAKQNEPESPPKEDKAAKKAQTERAAQLRRDLIEEMWIKAYSRAIGARFAKPRKADYPLMMRLTIIAQQLAGMSEQMELATIIADDDTFHDECRACVSLLFNVDAGSDVQSYSYEDLSIDDLRQIAAWVTAPPLPHWMPSAELLKTLTDKELTGLRDELELEEGVLDDQREELEKRVLAEWQPGRLGDGWCPDLFQLPGDV